MNVLSPQFICICELRCRMSEIQFNKFSTTPRELDFVAANPTAWTLPFPVHESTVVVRGATFTVRHTIPILPTVSPHSLHWQTNSTGLKTTWYSFCLPRDANLPFLSFSSQCTFQLAVRHVLSPQASHQSSETKQIMESVGYCYRGFMRWHTCDSALARYCTSVCERSLCS